MPYESRRFLPKVYNFLNSFFIPVDKTIPNNPSHANIPFSALKLLVLKYFPVSWCVSDVSNMKAQSSLNSQCCYITVDSAMAASQNGFCSYKFSIHKKTSIMQIMAKNIKIFIYLIFYHREIVKLYHFMTLSLSSATTVM